MNRPQQHLEDLIVRHLSGELEPREEEELAALLAESIEARELFASYIRLEGATIQLATAGYLSTTHEESPIADRQPVETVIPTPTSLDHPAAPRSLLFWAAAVCILAALALYQFWPRPLNDTKLPGVEISIAKLVRAVDVHWQDTDLPTRIGATLGPGTLSISAGIVEILFDSGVTLIVEGPADFELVSDRQGYLHRGKVRGVVPKAAQGFTILAPELKVVDLGNEFGLQVDEAGSSEIHVFDGEVEIHSEDVAATAPNEILSAGTAIRIDNRGQRYELDADDESFVGPTMLAMVAENYMTELQQQLGTLQQRESELRKNIASEQREIRVSQEVVVQDEAVAAALRAIQEFGENHPKLVRADQQLSSQQQKAEKLLEQVTADDPEFRSLRSQQDRVTQELGKLKKSIRESQKARDSARLRSLRAAQTAAMNARKNVNQQLVALRRKLQESDIRVKTAFRQAQATRKASRQMPDYDQYAQLQRALTDAKKLRHNTLKRLSNNDSTLRKLRAESKLMSMRIKKLKKDVKDARVVKKA